MIVEPVAPGDGQRGEVVLARQHGAPGVID